MSNINTTTCFALCQNVKHLGGVKEPRYGFSKANNDFNFLYPRFSNQEQYPQSGIVESLQRLAPNLIQGASLVLGCLSKRPVHDKDGEHRAARVKPEVLEQCRTPRPEPEER